MLLTYLFLPAVRHVVAILSPATIRNATSPGRLVEVALSVPLSLTLSLHQQQPLTCAHLSMAQAYYLQAERRASKVGELQVWDSALLLKSGKSCRKGLGLQCAADHPVVSELLFLELCW